MKKEMRKMCWGRFTGEGNTGEEREKWTKEASTIKTLKWLSTFLIRPSNTVLHVVVI